MKKVFLVLLALVFSFVAVKFLLEISQKCDFKIIAFYNVENLFDTINNPLVYDDEYTPTGKKRWTSHKYYDKIEKISKVIFDIGNEKFNTVPAVVGLCEVENEEVVKDLINSSFLRHYNYDFVFFKSNDARGLNTALLFHPKQFKLLTAQANRVKLPNYRTRNILLISGIINQEKIYILVNHWQSRLLGISETNLFRVEAAKHCRRIIDSIQLIDNSAKIVIMGDFNDEMHNESITKHLQATTDSANIKPTELFNTMEKFVLQNRGSSKYKNQWQLYDQMIISQSLLNNQSSFYFYDVDIYSPDYLIRDGAPLRSFFGNWYTGGYSDHLPIYLTLLVKN